MTDDALLEIDDLEKHFTQNRSLTDRLFGRNDEPIQAVDGVSLSLERGESQAVIGESGCGKTTLLLTLVGLHDITGGDVRYDGASLTEFSRSEWKNYRGNIQVIFQDPFNSLDPKLTVRETLEEQLSIHGMEQSDGRIHEILEQVELSPPEQFADTLPEELSGGEKQRVSIARALIVEPDIILADEPVSMLDVSTQAAVLNMLEDLIDDLGVAMLYISHDLSTVSYIAEYVNVMYLGRVVEAAPTEALIGDPKHPYSRALVSAIPIPDPHHDRTRTELEGTPSDPIGIGEGCRFRDRCPEYMDVCEQTPRDVDLGENRRVACHLYGGAESVPDTEGLDEAELEAQEQDAEEQGVSTP